MKSLLVLFLLIFSTADVAAYQVFGGGAASTLDGQPGSYYLDVGNHTGENSFGALADDNTGLGTVYDLTTSFQTYTSYGITHSSSDITLSASNGTITLGVDSAGEYNVQADISVTAVGGVELEFGIFRNDTTELSTFVRGIRGVHHHPPVLINLSSNAAYNTYSTVDLLEFAEGDVIWIDEASSGVDPLLFDMTFDDEVLYPTGIEFINVLYDGTASHEVEAKMWNYSSSIWDDMRSSTFDFPDTGGADAYRYYNREFEVPTPISNYVDISTKEAKMRIHHTSDGSPGDEFFLDKVQLHDSHASAAVSIIRTFTLSAGDSISFKIRSTDALPVYFANLHFHATKISN